MRALLPLVLFALACTDASARPRTAFDGARALEYVQTQVAFGPRVPGTPGHQRAGDWIAEQARARADTVIEQRWNHVTAAGDTLPLRNILARFRPEATQRILYLAHWDTRPTADNERNLGARQQAIPGANDGGSGVALLLALADQLKATPPSVGVDLLFVDGEDYGTFEVTEDPELRDVLIGSRYFAANLPDSAYRPMFGVLWDMVGDANLEIWQEAYSLQAAPEVVSRVWQVAKDLGYDDVFIDRNVGAITDDHVPLIEAGLRVIDVIDICYGEPQRGCPPNPPAPGTNYHHTMQDTIDKVSARSLQIVGDVALTLVRQF